MNILIIIYLGLISTSLFLNVIFPYKNKSFKTIFQVLVHYGKSSKKKPSSAGGKNNLSIGDKFVNWTVPKKWFAYFYLWGTIWTVIVILTVNSVQYNYSTGSIFFTAIQSIIDTFYYPSNALSLLVNYERRPLSFDAQMVLFFIFLQVSRRCFESFYIMPFGSSRMHFGHFLFGVFFYTSLPLLAILQQDYYHYSRGLDWYHGLALLLFIFASWHQHVCHVILANIKREQLVSGQYSIPEGDWFEYVSSPHYTGEILIYCALFVCSGCCNYYMLLPLASTTVTLSVVARETHYWYGKNFKSYPRKRKIIIPFVF